MIKENNSFEILSEKTKQAIEMFIINSFLSVDENKRKEFQGIIHKVISDCIINQNLPKNHHG